MTKLLLAKNKLQKETGLIVTMHPEEGYIKAWGELDITEYDGVPVRSTKPAEVHNRHISEVTDPNKIIRLPEGPEKDLPEPPMFLE